MEAMSLDARAIAKLAGSRFEYDYRELPLASDADIGNYIHRTRALAAPIAQGFDDARNSEWFVRSYLALKFVLAATLFGNSALYARDRNLQIVQPYLSYYLMLNCCRAFIFSLPCLPWRGSKSVEMTHRNILNTAIDKLKRLNSEQEERCGTVLRAAKEQRDLFSYRFPMSGLAVLGGDLVDLDEAIRIGRLFTELAQLNLACLEGAVAAKAPGVFSILEIDEIWRTIRYETSNNDLIDDDDYYRVGYFHRKYTSPVALIALATEGLIEDFFGSWHDDVEDGFNPDHNNRLLLDLL
jgi:hypothetical protein